MFHQFLHGSGLDWIRVALPGYMAQAFDNTPDALRRRDDSSACPLHNCGGRLLLSRHLQQVTGIGMDNSQGVVNLVGDASCHQAEGGEPSGSHNLHTALLELGFQRYSRADVTNDAADQNTGFRFQWAQTDLDGKFAAVLASAEEFQPGAHGPDLPLLRKRLTVVRVCPSETLGHKQLDRLPEQLFAAVAKYLFGLHVNDDNLAVISHRHDGIWRRFRQTLEAVVHLATIRSVWNLHKPREPSAGPS